MSGTNVSNKTYNMVMTGLLMCLVTLATMLFKVPILQGYIHLGNSMMIMSVMILGKRNGAIASGIGTALADILGGFAIWSPWSLAIGALTALTVGFFAEKEKKPIGFFLGCLIIVIGYYIAEVVIYGNLMAPLAGVPWNIGQFVVGALIAYALSKALCKTPAKKLFAISL